MKYAVAFLAVASLSGGVRGDIVTLNNVPDFSQHANAGWSNYCAPTNGANLAYYFGQSGFSMLLQGNPIGPGAAADFGATTIIGGTQPGSPPPPAGSMAQRMNTSLQLGTTAFDIVVGLDGYFEDNWDGIAGGLDWITTYHDAAMLGGSTFWNILQSEINAGSGIILTIAWPFGVPSQPWDTPKNYFPNIGPNAFLGHAVTMTGYDNDPLNPKLIMNDPANNSGVHNWPGESASYAVNIGLSDLSFTITPGDLASVYGAVIIRPIPGPGGLAVIAVGVVIGARRRRS
jgi:hypothetical protein